jgi:cell division protein FtsI/penicillin-binding protein 2
MKPFVLLALLESGKLRPTTGYVCPRTLRIGERDLACSHAPVPAPLDPVAALAYSCNNYFARFAALLTLQELDSALSRAGITQATGLAENEATGEVRPSRERNLHLLKALGEADVTVSPLGLLAAYRKLALKVKNNSSPNSPVGVVLEGLVAVTQVGTGVAARMDGLEIAGKTGTARSRDGHWTHAWFVAFTPARAPEIVLVVFLEQGQGGRDAVPVAQEILAAWKSSKERGRR